VCSRAESIGLKNASARYAVAIPSRSGKAVATEATRSVRTHSSEMALVRSWTKELGSAKAEVKVSGEANGAYGSTMSSSMEASMVEGRVSG
jgi:hypothetical protein